MDWKYVLSLNPDDLGDEDKDALLNTIAWYDCDVEEIDVKKSVGLLKISQEIMKYKSEQVEALMAELDEVATRLGEEELKKQESEYDTKSLKSKKSSSLDDFEDKYRETKTTLKQQISTNKKQKKELEKLKQRINVLEQERIHLQNELRAMQQDDVQSDISETVKDQHRELIDTVHQKNNQISQLLNDIEAIENENVVLKEQLTAVRDELVDATKQMNMMTDELTASKLNLEDKMETITNLTHEADALRAEIQELDDERKSYEKQVEEFAIEIDSRVDEWKRILDEKNNEIKELKTRSLQHSRQSSVKGDSEPTSQAGVLNQVINERDDQILELQSQLQNATKEMEECTDMLNKLMADRDSDKDKILSLNGLVKELKMQMRTSHDRCQELQEQVKYAENISEKKDKDLNDLLNKLKSDGFIELSEVLSKVQDLKMQKRYREKQVSDLVRTANKLQNSLHEIENENVELRARLGIPEDETVSTTGMLTKQRKQKKELQEIKKKASKLEEEKLSLRLEIQKLNRTVSNVTNQLIELGETPDVDGETSERQLKSIDKEVSEAEQTVPKSKYVGVVEENEALRKGLHEIMQSVQAKTESTGKELKSETLEQLLRALDAKHISGWYHPAMRVQAELHAMQGVNAELREQLKYARSELTKYQKEMKTVMPGAVQPDVPHLERLKVVSSSNADVIANLNKHLLKVLEECRLHEVTENILTEKVEKYRNDFEIVGQQVNLLYKQYTDEKATWTQEKDDYTKRTSEVSEKVELLEVKLKEISKFASLSGDDQAKLRQISEISGNVVTLNRKCLYLENENNKLSADLRNAKHDLLNAEVEVKKKVSTMTAERNDLKSAIAINEAKLNHCVDLQSHMKLQKNFDNLTAKHRGLLSRFNEIGAQSNNEFEVLKERVELLGHEKEEVMDKLRDAVLKLNTFEVSTFEVDKAKEVLSKKLAQCEINEITERQRANHTNNLYELVKEQLRKSEERFKEFETYNKEIMHKNLFLQEKMNDLQDKIVSGIDVNEFTDLKNRCVALLEENKKLTGENDALRRDLEATDKTDRAQKLWSSSQEYELLSLKHQILDLQAATDDKAVIARLSSDVVHARLIENETQKKLESVSLELKKREDDYEAVKSSLDENKKNKHDVLVHLNKKISVLQDVIMHQREQYYGFIPLTSEGKFIDSIAQIYKDKHDAFVSLRNAQNTENETSIFKEQVHENMRVLEEAKLLNNNEDFNSKLTKWYNEKNTVQLQELRYRRKSEFIDSQLQQALERVKLQDKQMSILEEELLLAYQRPNLALADAVTTIQLQPSEKEVVQSTPKQLDCKVKLYKSADTQTLFDTSNNQSDAASLDTSLNSLQIELINTQNELAAKDETIGQMKSKVTELEMNLSLFRNQLGDKQSQIMFYEKHILELKSKKEQVDSSSADEPDVSQVSNEEIIALKTSIATLQATLVQKEECILKYQSLLKQDRDEHSLAAARLQDELKRLQNVLTSQQQAYKELQEAQIEHPGKAAIEQYVKQVHALENHTSELHTNVSSLESQLQASREESVRWRGLASDRLESMEELRKELDGAHKGELAVYKNECEKWRHEVNNLRLLISKRNDESSDKTSDLQRAMKEKDDKIHELSVLLRQSRFEIKKKVEVPESPKVYELEAVKEQLGKEHDTLKKRFEQLMNREKNAREEIRALKGQLMRRPALSARNEKSDTAKDQLQKKVTGLEREIDELKDSLQKQLAMNEAHRVKVAEDFEKWNKQKYFQQTAEKLKGRLKEKSDEYEKLHQTCAGYRMLIERLEREKHALENRVKSLKSTGSGVGGVKMEMLELENAKLRSEMDGLNCKLEMQHHHSGSLGAAMLQDKLEAQERKLAILELSAKGSGELRMELERSQSTNASLQKTNLRLEAENLELKLDLEKSSKELPHLREQVHHLENYIEVLKAETSKTHEVGSAGDHPPQGYDSKKAQELERTVFVLKRIVEKLQVENKRLHGGAKPCVGASDRTVSDESLRRDYRRLKEQYGDSVQKIARLEEELKAANNKSKMSKNKQVPDNVVALSEELSEVRTQLSQKSELLDKVKVLLHRAAVKEKSMLETIAQLKSAGPSATSSP